jgi:hypothetical protein
MKTALEHPQVAAYLRQLDDALASLEPKAAAELSEQFRAHIVEALPPGASDDMVTWVLAALGPPAVVAAEAGLSWPERSRAWRSLWRRIAVGVRRTPVRAWLIIGPVVGAMCLAAGTLTFWVVQPGLGSNGGTTWWYPADVARNVITEAGDATQNTVPLRPGQLQGFAVLLYNPSGVSERILGPALHEISPGSGEPPQIAVATTTPIRLEGEPHMVRYEAGGAIPPHSYRWVRVLWRSEHCYLEAVGGTQGTNVLTVRVKVGWITRTEAIQLPAWYSLSATKANVQAAYCKVPSLH